MNFSAEPTNQEARDIGTAVLHRALCDAVLPSPPGAADMNVQREAQMFCTDVEGEFAESRALWCDIANVNPDIYRAEALRRIAAGNVPSTPASLHTSNQGARA